MKNSYKLAVGGALFSLLVSFAAAGADSVEISVGFENNPAEPFGQGVEKWKELLERRSRGTMTISIFPNSLLGTKEDLMDQMAQGEPVCTLTDGAFFADRGVKDMGIVFGPYLFDSWEEAFKLIDSPWYAEQSALVESAAGLKILAANWKYGTRHTLTVSPLTAAGDFSGLRIRVPTNLIQVKAYEVLGAEPTPMPLDEVYYALADGEIDGVENPLAVLYNGGFQDYAKNLLLDAHVYNVTNLVVGESFWKSLSEEQQQLLVETCREAGEYQNRVLDEMEAGIIAKFKAEGVSVTEPSAEFRHALREASAPFYSLPDFSDWSPGLYETVVRQIRP